MSEARSLTAQSCFLTYKAGDDKAYPTFIANKGISNTETNVWQGLMFNSREFPLHRHSYSLTSCLDHDQLLLTALNTQDMSFVRKAGGSVAVRKPDYPLNNLFI